jgi:hypothetical protein
MKAFKLLTLFTLLTGALFILVGLSTPVVQEPSEESMVKANQGETDLRADAQFAPVDNMHHFMEYVCEPSYKELKALLAKEPEDRRGWKAFKNHALVLAETSALVAARSPKDESQAKQWKQISLDVYNSGKSLYKSSGNYEEAQKHFGSMVDNCNKCHKVFAKGKHQLKK